VIACIAASAPAAAQMAGPCTETVARHCKDVTPGGGRIMKCLDAHRDDQSIACRDWLDGQKERLRDLNAACAEEIARLCSFDPPDGIRIYQCLESNYIALKIDCRDKLREIKDRLQ
jgi:hypothetical protein